ncbi:MAG: superoxide dismutase family protein [Candidatus Onthomonas sp.]
MFLPSGLLAAAAQISGGDEAPKLSGTAKFYLVDGGVLVVVDVSGMPQDNSSGFFALHIHEGPDCSGAAFADTGGHFNPTGQLHPNHAGDLPPLLSFRGRAFLAVLTGRFRISDVIGRTVVIHSGPDDFKTQPSGNSGAKIACGVIRAV